MAKVLRRAGYMIGMFETTMGHSNSARAKRGLKHFYTNYYQESNKIQQSVRLSHCDTIAVR